MPHVKLHVDHLMVIPLSQNVACRAPGAQNSSEHHVDAGEIRSSNILAVNFFERSVEECNTLEKGICMVHVDQFP